MLKIINDYFIYNLFSYVSSQEAESRSLVAVSKKLTKRRLWFNTRKLSSEQDIINT